MQSVFALVGLTSSQGLALLVCVAVFATVMSVALPMLSGNELKSRMKAVALEREEVRARERARMSIEKERGRKGSVRQAENKGVAAAVVEKFDLKSALADEKTVSKLRIAGYRGQRPLTLFLETDDNGFRFEAMLPIGQGPAGDRSSAFANGVRPGLSPGGPSLRFVHVAPYDDIDSTYETITAYLEAKGITVKDAFLEEYVGDLADPADPNLEINVYVQPR